MSPGGSAAYAVVKTCVERATTSPNQTRMPIAASSVKRCSARSATAPSRAACLAHAALSAPAALTATKPKASASATDPG